ncbi:MAG: hypothetical protein JXA21_25800 [Anaerolineae bacterium]|nr:hypothetical protein [Anaerolineae bacterium]
MEKTTFFEKLKSLNEDWRALIVGLTLTLLVWIGVIPKVPWPIFGLWK